VMPKRTLAPITPIRPSPVRTAAPARKASPSNRMIPAFATFFVLLLLLTFSWIAWDRGEKTPPFDVLMAAAPPPAVTFATETGQNRTDGRENIAAFRVSSAQDGAQAEPGEGETGQPANAPPGVMEPHPANHPVSKVAAGSASQTSIAAGFSQNDEILIVLVEKEVTVRQLSLQYIGRFDEIVLGEIYTLNPELLDAGHITIGERLRLPLYLRKEFKSVQPAAIRSASLEALKDAR
jgi:hypothetical protein